MAGQRKLTSFFSKQLSPSDPPDQERDPEEDTSLVSNSQDGPAAASEIRNDELHPAKKQRTLFHPLDIGNFVRKDLTSESALTDEQRYEALVNAWKPDVNYHFPKISESGRNRCFQHGYLDKWPWLAYSEMHDETRDAGKTDQLTICLRYVGVESGKHVLKEVFLKFCEVVDKTGAGLARTIMDNLESEGLDVRNLRGQGYDGASAMSGQYRGVQAEIKAVVPEALYFHCASHCLNLALVHSANVSASK